MFVDRMQNQPRSTHILSGVCALTWRYLHWPTIGSISHFMFASGKEHLPIERIINLIMHASAMAYAHRQGYFSVDKRKKASAKASALHPNDISQQYTT